MTPQDIDKAFQGRWHMKQATVTDLILRAFYGDHPTVQEISSGIESLCRDFLEAGIMLADKDCVIDKPKFVPTCEVHVSQFLPDGTSTPWQELDPFEYWWNLYDLKVGKEKCMKKWSKLTEKEKSECIAATPSYVHSTPDKQFRKRPLTYLNGKCWNDEIIIKNEPSKPTLEEQRLNKLAAILTD